MPYLNGFENTVRCVTFRETAKLVKVKERVNQDAHFMYPVYLTLSLVETQFHTSAAYNF